MSSDRHAVPREEARRSSASSGSTGTTGTTRAHEAGKENGDTKNGNGHRADLSVRVGASTPETIAAIPAYNEELSIGSVVHQAREHVDMVVVLDDGSTDDTGAIARRAGARVLRHRENQGKAQAIRTLFDWALEMDVEHVVLLDGDGQHDPGQIPEMLRPVQQGEADVALGFRFGDNTEMPLYRRVGKRVLDYATALGTDGEVTDSQCGFRAFNREAMSALELREDGFAVESEMVVSANENGLEMAEVPITCRYEGVDNASTEDPVTHGVGVLERTIRLITERRPLLFMGVPGFLSVLAGIGLGTWVVWTLKMTGQFAVGTALVTSTLVLAGTFLGLTAILLHVIPTTLEKHLGAQATIEVEDAGLPAASDAVEATASKGTNGSSDDPEEGPRPRPPEEIPDWTEPSEEEIPSSVEP